MLRPGDKVRITTYENGPGQVVHYGCVVLEYESGLLKITQSGDVKIYNMRSIGFHSAEIEK